MSAANVTISEDLKNLPKRVVDNVLLMRLANGGLAIIRKRTLAGEFLEGSSPGAEKYSTTAMPMPLGRFTKLVQKKLTKEQLQRGEEYRIFTSKSGNTWIVVQGGYEKFRELAGKYKDHVVMSWSGRMLRNLGVVRTSNTDAEIGFSNDETKQLATWHNIMGAGKSKRKHVFMGFTPAELEHLGKIAGADIAAKLQKL